MGIGFAWSATPDQRTSWDQWISRTPQPEQIKLTWRADAQVLRSAFGVLRNGRAGVALQRQVDNFVDELVPRYGVRASQLKPLGLEGTGRFKVARYQQTFQGLPVVQRQLSIRVRDDGAILGFESDLAAFDGSAAPAKISPDQAKRTAQNHLKAKNAKVGAPTEVIMAQGTTPLRMFQVDVALPGMRFYSVYVRADTGKVLWVRDRVIH
jgi:hypothetical protein